MRNIWLSLVLRYCWLYIVIFVLPLYLLYFSCVCNYTDSSGGFRGGDGGDASPPTSLKVTILAKKSASISNNSAPVRDASPHQPKPNEPGRKITPNFGEDLFFFFFFFWRPPNFRRKKRLNFRYRPKNHSQFWWRPFFFFFFFRRPPDFGQKKVWISAFGRKITLNFGEDIRIFEILCLKSPPHQNFLDPPLTDSTYILNKLSCFIFYFCVFLFLFLFLFFYFLFFLFFIFLFFLFFFEVPWLG